MHMQMKEPSAATQQTQGNVMGVNSLGVNITTRPMGAHSQRDGAVSHSDKNTIQEPSWDLRKMVERPQIVNTSPWTDVYASHTVLMDLNIPFDIYNSNSFIVSPFSSFNFWRGGLEFHLQCTGTPFHYGTVIMAFIPLEDDATYNVGNFSSLTALQHVILQANSATSVCMTVPFIHHNDYLTLSDNTNDNYNFLGRLVVVVLNPLIISGTVSHFIDVSLAARFVDSEFKIPYPPAPPSFKGESFGKIIQKMLPKNIVADTIDTIAGVVGLDRPTSIQVGEPMKMLGTQYMNSSVAIDYNDKLSIFPAQLQETEPSDFGMTVAETSFDYLKKKYTYLGTKQWLGATAAGNLIASFPITPCPVPLTTVGTGPVIRNQVPLLQYITLPFQQWRGGLTYKIQAVASSFHIGKLFISINYGSFGIGATPISVGAMSNQYGYAFEINQGSQEFEFTVPYVSATHSKFVPDSNRPDEDTAMGQINVYVMNAMAVPSTVPFSLFLNFFIAGADDFSVSTATQGNGSLIPVADLLTTFVGESAVGNDLLVNTEEVEKPLVISPQDMQTRSRYKNELPVTNWLQVLKKYHQVARGILTVGNMSDAELNRSNACEFPIMDMLTSTAYPAMKFHSTPHFINWPLFLYRGFRGPLRFKVVMEVIPVNYAMYVYYLPPGAGTYDIAEIIDNCDVPSWDITGTFSARVTPPMRLNMRPKMHIATAIGVQKSLEFEIPYTQINNFAPMDAAQYNSVATASDLGTLLFFCKPTLDLANAASTSTDVAFSVFCAFGDETRLGVLTRVPSIIVNSYQGGTAISTTPDLYDSSVSYNTLTRL